MAIHEGSKDSYTMVGGEEVSPSTARYGKGKVPYNLDKCNQQESALRLRCFIHDGSHLTRECPKREALNALVKKREKEEHDVHLGSMQMIGTL